MTPAPPPEQQPGQPSGQPSGQPMVASRRLARVMDDLVTIPGTRFGIGLDAVLGLLPGVGDVLGSALSGAIVLDAIRHRVPVPVLARMGLNLIVDALLGLVPGIGDLIDIAHRANRKNLRLLEQAVARSPVTGRPSAPPTAGYLLAAVALVVVPLAVGLALGVAAIVVLIRWLVS